MPMTSTSLGLGPGQGLGGSYPILGDPSVGLGSDGLDLGAAPSSGGGGLISRPDQRGQPAGARPRPSTC